MLADVVQSNFPEGVKLPDCLQTVCDYVDIHGYPLSGSFEICDWGRKDAEGWFPNDAATRSQVTIFGRGSTGSSYALWLVPNRNPDEAPVVVFGSEGTSSYWRPTPLSSAGCSGWDTTSWSGMTSQPDHQSGRSLRGFATGWQKDCGSTSRRPERPLLETPESGTLASSIG